jgi:hypothetical protein
MKLATVKRQFCRTCLRSCVPAVTLKVLYGRLHWCADHTADADLYREVASIPHYSEIRSWS